jgi:hypothetical protein
VSQAATEVLIGVVVAIILAVGGLLWRRARRTVEERHPVSYSVSHVLGDEWSLALAGDLPDDAAQVEGGDFAGRDVYDWLTARGAVDVGETRLRLTVRGLAEETVVVRDLRLTVEHEAPFSGTLVHCPTAGANSATLLVFDLDEGDPRGWEWQEDGSRTKVGTSPFFDTHNVTLAHEEVQDFIVLGCAKTLLARWHIQLHLEVGAHREVVVIDDGGKPFVTCGRPLSGYLATLDWAWYDGRRFLPPPADV